jgi:hypothetical protein
LNEWMKRMNETNEFNFWGTDYCADFVVWSSNTPPTPLTIILFCDDRLFAMRCRRWTCRRWR